MLPKKNRTTRKDVGTVFQKGVSFWGKNVGLKFYKSTLKTPPKVSFVVSKKVEKLANKRNALKRKGYLAIKSFMHKLPLGFNGVFTLKNKEINTELIKQDVEKILNKIN